MTVAVLRPASCFAGVVRDDGGRAWALYVGPSPLPGHVRLLARNAARMFAGHLDVREGLFDSIEPLNHGQRRPFLDAIAAHLVRVARIADWHDIPMRGAVELLAGAMAERGQVA